MTRRHLRKRWLIGATAVLTVPAGLLGYSMPDLVGYSTLPSEAAPPAAGAVYQLQVTKSRMCVDVPQASRRAGARLQQWGCTDGAAWQQFELVASGSAFLLQNVESGMCIDGPAGLHSSSVQVQQWGCSSSQSNQQWRLADTRDGTFQIVNVNSGRCLSGQGASTTAGTAIIQEICTTNSNKQWTFRPVPNVGAGTGSSSQWSAP